MRDSPKYKNIVEVSGMMVVFFHDFVMTVRKVMKRKGDKDTYNHEIINEFKNLHINNNDNYYLISHKHFCFYQAFLH